MRSYINRKDVRWTLSRGVSPGEETLVGLQQEELFLKKTC
jgi:hypothetical protein